MSTARRERVKTEETLYLILSMLAEQVESLDSIIQSQPDKETSEVPSTLGETTFSVCIVRPTETSLWE